MHQQKRINKRNEKRDMRKFKGIPVKYSFLKIQFEIILGIYSKFSYWNFVFKSYSCLHKK